MQASGQSRAAKRKQKQKLKKRQKDAAAKQGAAPLKRPREEDSGTSEKAAAAPEGREVVREGSKKPRLQREEPSRGMAAPIEVKDTEAALRSDTIVELLRPFLETSNEEEEDAPANTNGDAHPNDAVDEDDAEDDDLARNGSERDEREQATDGQSGPSLFPDSDDTDGSGGNTGSLHDLKVPEVPAASHPGELCPKARAEAILQWLLGPVAVDSFFDEYWERRPLLVKRVGDTEYFARVLPELASVEKVREVVNTNYMIHGKDLDVTLFDSSSGVRKTLAPKPRKQPPKDAAADEADSPGIPVDPSFVWRNFGEGCSVRLRCPQQHSDDCWRFLSALEDAFGSMVGANLYVTPGSHQGFAPHYDDIEAFILQLSGEKRWRVYSPSDGDDLPRLSSSDFSKDAMASQVGEPLLETVLRPGDLLYFPRGFIHQAETVSGKPSIHLTVSAGQQNALVDFCEFAIPEALAAAAASAPGRILREGLPRDWLAYFGAVHSDRPSTGEAGEWEDRRKAFKLKLQACMQAVTKSLLDMLDPAADQFSLKYLSDRLQPAIPLSAALRSAADSPKEPLTPLTLLRIVRPGVARLAVEEGKLVLYHCMENARTYRGTPLQSLEFEMDDGPAIEKLLFSWPKAVQIAKLPHPTGDIHDKLELAKSLYQESLLEIVGEASPFARLLPPT